MRIIPCMDFVLPPPVYSSHTYQHSPRRNFWEFQLPTCFFVISPLTRVRMDRVLDRQCARKESFGCLSLSFKKLTARNTARSSHEVGLG